MMKLAEMLVPRTDSQKKIAQLKQRLDSVVKSEHGPRQLRDYLQTSGDMYYRAMKLAGRCAYAGRDCVIGQVLAIYEPHPGRREDELEAPADKSLPGECCKLSATTVWSCAAPAPTRARSFTGSCKRCSTRTRIRSRLCTC